MDLEHSPYWPCTHSVQLVFLNGFDESNAQVFVQQYNCTGI